MDKPTKQQAGFTVDPAWISNTVRNEKTVEAFITTSVALANLAAELGEHLEEESFSMIRDQIADTVQFLGETLVLVSPPAKPKDMVPEAEDDRPARIDPIVTPTPAEVAKASAPMTKSAAGNAAVASVLAGMNPQAIAALASAGIKAPVASVAAPATPAPTPVAATTSATPAVAQGVGAPVMERTEASLVKTAKSDVRVAEDLIKSSMDADGSLANHPIVVGILGAPAKSDYEAAAVLAETWRK
jgi:hypothetical protein